MTVNQEFITKKINKGQEYLAIARSVLALNDKEILSSIKELATLERYFSFNLLLYVSDLYTFKYELWDKMDIL